MDNYSSKLSRIKLVTKVSATSKLLRICLCIRLSRQKLEQKYCKDVQVHYAILSGTLEEKGRKTEYFPKSKDYEEELEGGQMTTKSS